MYFDHRLCLFKLVHLTLCFSSIDLHRWPHRNISKGRFLKSLRCDLKTELSEMHTKVTCFRFTYKMTHNSMHAIGQAIELL